MTSSNSNFSYATFTERNAGYISAEAQKRIQGTTLLIAGCGIGSGVATCAARMGFESFVLVDGDTVGQSNLNRQFFDFADIDRPKVEALKDHILRINPSARVTAVNAFLDVQNTDAIVSKADIIIDTVDFLDLPAILKLHTSAKEQGKPIFSALNAGFGAMVWYFTGKPECPSLPEIIRSDIEKAAAQAGKEPSYAEVFQSFMGRIAPYFDDEVQAQVSSVLKLMHEGKACPASQVSPGSFCTAAMLTSILRDIFCGHPVVASPQLLIHSLHSQKTTRVDLSEQPAATSAALKPARRA